MHVHRAKMANTETGKNVVHRKNLALYAFFYKD